MIRKSIKIELYRVFTNKIFYITLFVCSLIGIIQFFLMVYPKTNGLFDGINMSYPYSVFYTSLIFDSTTVYYMIFFYSLPLFCALPYATSYFTDLKNGNIKNICTRMDRRSYYIGKYISVFISAGLICIIPIIINMILTMMVLPDLIPERGTNLFFVIETNPFVDIFYLNPYLYFLIYLCIDFIICGLLVCSTLAISKFAHNRFIVLFTPFAIFFMNKAVTEFSSLYEYNIFNIISPVESTPFTITSLVTLIIVLFVFSFGVFYIGGKKSDII